jgi:hypothetical protein
MKRLTCLLLLCLTLSFAFAQSPGNVTANLQWWFKANDGTEVTVDSAQVNTWLNRGAFKTKSLMRMQKSSKGYPMFMQNKWNSNAVVQFSEDSIGGFQTFPSDFTNMLPTEGNCTFVVVFQSAQVKGNVLGLHYYSPYFFGTESEATTVDFEFGFANGTVVMKCDSVDRWSAGSKAQYADQVGHIAMGSKQLGPVESSNCTLNLLIDGFPDLNTKTLPSSSLLNSANYQEEDYYHGFTVGVQINHLLDHLTPKTAFDGSIAEIIVYDRVLSAVEMRAVNSYLAIKYGITLNQTISSNYVSASGNIVWDAASFGVFNKDIAGIGIDPASGLTQLQSQSINPGAMVTMKQASSLDANDFLLWSDNGLSPSAITYKDIAAPIEARLARVWQIQQTGEVGTVTVQLDLSAVPGNINVEDLRLLLDDDGVFNQHTTMLTPQSMVNKIVTFHAVAFNAQTALYFTLGSVNRAQTPLSVNSIPRPELVIYELVTPNHDGFNDGFKILNLEYFPDNELFIYTHEGIEIFHQQKFTNGAWNVAEVADGFYYYVFKTGSIKRSGEIVVKH